jgi:hypothetical protein
MNLTSWLVTAFVTGLLVFNFAICSMLSYWGYGVQPVGPHSLRSGSIWGPTLIGGGPGEGGK